MLCKLTLLVLAVCFSSSHQHTGKQGHGSCPHTPVPREDPRTCCHLWDMTAAECNHINPFCTRDGYLCYIPNLHLMRLKKCAGYCELSETLTGIFSGFGRYHYHCNNGACSCNCCVPRDKREVKGCACCIPFKHGCRNGVIVSKNVPTTAQIKQRARYTSSKAKAPSCAYGTKCGPPRCQWYEREYRIWIPTSCYCRHCGCGRRICPASG